MYVRLVSLSGASPGKRENMIQAMRENVVPTLRRYEGSRATSASTTPSSWRGIRD